MDAVRVRPLHEEMTASLLEEVEKRRAQKTSRGSASSDAQGSDETARATTAIVSVGAAATAHAAIRAQASSATGVAGTTSTSKNASPRGKGMHAASPAGADSQTPAAGGSHPRNGASSCGSPNGREENEGAALLCGGQDGCHSADQKVSGGGASETAAAEDHAEVIAAAKRLEVAERRRAALATIENQRAFPACAAGAAQEGKDRLDVAPAVPTATTLTASAASSSDRVAAVQCRPHSRMSAAFSAQSVRSGATLGYYGREEVDVLSAISKNPSRIAAYNRITEVKQGNQRDGEPGPEVRVQGQAAM